MNNRIIKFRVWNEEDNSWCGKAYPGVAIDKNDYDKLEKLIFQQFTGLLDKNGKEIYEGDILEQAEEFSDCIPDDIDINDKRIVQYPTDARSGLIFRGEIVGKVQFRDQAFRFRDHVLGGCYKIIGNIFENPELLNKRL